MSGNHENLCWHNLMNCLGASHLTSFQKNCIYFAFKCVLKYIYPLNIRLMWSLVSKLKTNPHIAPIILAMQFSWPTLGSISQSQLIGLTTAMIIYLHIEFHSSSMKFNLEMHFSSDYRLFSFNCSVLEKDGEASRKL